MKERVPGRKSYRAAEATFEKTTEEELTGNEDPWE